MDEISNFQDSAFFQLKYFFGSDSIWPSSFLCDRELNQAEKVFVKVLVRN